MPAELSKWAAPKLKQMTGSSDTTLLDFCMSLENDEDIRQYIFTYLGRERTVVDFADGFCTRKTALTGSWAKPKRKNKRR
jgi:hypothetical protein